jgi:phage shock protein A
MFQRLGNLVRGFFSIFVSGLERQNPEALLEIEQENLRRQVGKFNTSLAAHAGLVERLIAQVRKLEMDETDLRAKTSANLKLGNRESAGQYALRLQTVERELAENRKQMEQAETTYKELVRARDVAVGIARNKIEALKSGISDMKMKRAMAEITEMASGMVTDLGGSGDTLNRLETIVNEERFKASGRVRVAVDSMDLKDIHIREAEQQAMASQALAAFEAKETGSLPASSAAPAGYPVNQGTKQQPGMVIRKEWERSGQ